MVPVFTIQLPRDVQARDHQRRLADNMYRLPVNTRMTYRKLEMRGYSRFEQQYRTVIVNKKITLATMKETQHFTYTALPISDNDSEKN